MKIAQIAPVIERVPPKKYGGTERMVHALTEELVARGHEVTLFASGDSITSAKLFPLLPKSSRETDEVDLYGESWMRLLGAGLPYQYQSKFDIIHDHNEPLSLPIAQFSEVPVVMTLHGEYSTGKRKLYQNFPKPYLISISQAQIPDDVAINHIATIHHGFNMEKYPFSDNPDNYLLFVGRISPEKGLHNAITASKRLNRQLVIAAKLDSKNMDYFKKYIEPELSDQILWIGEVNEEERNKLMSQALCFLHPVEWTEPFGLTLIESMACGTPVVAFNKGSIPEIILDRQTGFVVNTVEEMVSAVKQINKIDRKTCRRHVLDNFNVQRMTDEYEIIYNTILEGKYKQGTNVKTNGFHHHLDTKDSFY